MVLIVHLKNHLDETILGILDDTYLNCWIQTTQLSSQSKKPRLLLTGCIGPSQINSILKYLDDNLEYPWWSLSTLLSSDLTSSILRLTSPRRVVLFDNSKPSSCSSWNVLMIIPSLLGAQLEQRSVVSRGVKPWMNRLGKAVMRDQWTARWVRNKCTVNGGIPVVRAKKYQSAPFTATAYSPLAGGWTSTTVTEESKS